MSGEPGGGEVAPPNPIEARWGQAFPRLTSAQIAAAVGEGSACVQLAHRVLHE
jgi:hypothetical protein